jgi:hypothetical protein
MDDNTAEKQRLKEKIRIIRQKRDESIAKIRQEAKDEINALEVDFKQRIIKPNADRNFTILGLRTLESLTFADIGKKYNISRNTARQIVNHQERIFIYLYKKNKESALNIYGEKLVQALLDKHKI